MNHESAQFLAEGVARHAGLVLSVPTERGGLAHFKSRFIAQDAEGIWIQLPENATDASAAIAQKQLVGVTFKAGETRRVFATTIIRSQQDYPTTAGKVAALLLAPPPEVKAIQRRGEYRVRLAPGNHLILNCWIIPRRADLRVRPLPSQRLKLKIHDISMGGAGITLFGTDGQPPTLTRDDRLRVEIQLDTLEMLVEGRLRMPDTTTENSLRTGIRFFFFDDGLDERLKRSQLTKIIGRLQIAQVKAVRKHAETQHAAVPAEEPTSAAVTS